jgi:hypothetical protein
MRFQVNPDGVRAAMQSPTVRAGLRKRGEPIAGRARQLTAAEKVEGEVTTSEGIRPKGRPFFRVTHTNGAQEWGTSKTDRRRILGRAAGL